MIMTQETVCIVSVIMENFHDAFWFLPIIDQLLTPSASTSLMILFIDVTIDIHVQELGIL